MSEWQPIETVPRDGTVVDLWHIVSGRTPQVWWEPPEGWVSRGWVPLTVQEGFTHWMSLPDPPAKNGKQSR